jgi:hypothetical protein
LSLSKLSRASANSGGDSEELSRLPTDVTLLSFYSTESVNEQGELLETRQIVT